MRWRFQKLEQILFTILILTSFSHEILGKKPQAFLHQQTLESPIAFLEIIFDEKKSYTLYNRIIFTKATYL